MSISRITKTPLVLGDDRFVVPRNRWDLVADAVAKDRTVSVVIPYFDQPEQLSLVLAALSEQSYPPELIDVVVADDGSSIPPDTRAWHDPASITVVTQHDRGFRAAAARNLGAGASGGEILCFIDADTIPERDYVAESVRLCSLLPDAIVVGRRRHGDFGGWTADDVHRWSRSSGIAAVSELEEPQWLIDAYDRSRNLLHADWQNYRFVLSAVMTCSRVIFENIGGFDSTFEQYGGEDWECASRALNCGAVLAHVPSAVAWHDGPDWAVRESQSRNDQKNAESSALARRITDPAARTHGLSYRLPDTAALVDTEGHSPASLLITVGSLVSQRDCGVWLTGPHAEQLRQKADIDDHRVRVGAPEAEILSRCRFVMNVRGRVVFGPGSVDVVSNETSPDGAGEVHIRFVDAHASVTLRTSSAVHRSQRWAAHLGVTEDELMNTLFGTALCDAADTGISVSTTEPWLAW